jgi:hypothetical protein
MNCEIDKSRVRTYFLLGHYLRYIRRALICMAINTDADFPWKKWPRGGWGLMAGESGDQGQRIAGSGWVVPGYTELKPLGSGGFGTVLLARHDATGTAVAVKYLLPGLVQDPEFAALFRVEAEVLGTWSRLARPPTLPLATARSKARRRTGSGCPAPPLAAQRPFRPRPSTSGAARTPRSGDTQLVERGRSFPVAAVTDRGSQQTVSNAWPPPPGNSSPGGGGHKCVRGVPGIRLWDYPPVSGRSDPGSTRRRSRSLWRTKTRRRSAPATSRPRHRRRRPRWTARPRAATSCTG